MIPGFSSPELRDLTASKLEYRNSLTAATRELTLIVVLGFERRTKRGGNSELKYRNLIRIIFAF